LQQIAHGIYCVPQQHDLFGPIYPSAEKVAEGIAKKEQIKIKPAGAYALHRLGLSTQVQDRRISLEQAKSKPYRTNTPVPEIAFINSFSNL
jgi:hypothetical protein